ncbi:glycosyltransferase family 2 protein [Candidatus Woesearchaeota archaeon]|nr:glycosyltransferase family 2 protein [Candidatus Woesearchaeota archaeon]
MYKRKELVEINCFSTEGFSEDADVAIRLIRKGNKVVFSNKSIVHTYMPDDFKGIIRQRSRFARGTINILKRHLKANKLLIDLYTLPLLLFFYIQSIIMGSINLYQIFSGYFLYFISKGIYIDLNVLKFFFEWLSLIGFIKWSGSVILGLAPLTFLSAIVILTSLLSYPRYVYAILKYDKRIDLQHIIPLTFMFPFWVFVTIVYLISIPEVFSKTQYNKWNKNE